VGPAGAGRLRRHRAWPQAGAGGLGLYYMAAAAAPWPPVPVRMARLTGSGDPPAARPGGPQLGLATGNLKNLEHLIQPGSLCCRPTRGNQAVLPMPRQHWPTHKLSMSTSIESVTVAFKEKAKCGGFLSA
jgi:hypothetical protein